MLDTLEDTAYEIEFMNLIVDKADNLLVVDCDEHFCKFTGVNQSKIQNGSLFLHDFIKPKYRDRIMKTLCKKDSPYIYFDAEFIDKDGNEVYIHCTGQNWKSSTLCRLTLADVSKSKLRHEQLNKRAQEMNHLIDMVTGGVCLFKVTSDMHIEAHYMNEAACKLFGTSKELYRKQKHRFDELIHPEDKTNVFQAIGRAMATLEAVDTEFRTIVHKGEYRWCKFNAAIESYDEENNPIFHAMITDITSIKIAEQKADLMYERLIKVFKNVPTPVFQADLDNPLRLKLASEDLIKFLGYSRSIFFDEHDGRLSDFMTERDINYAIANIKKQAAAGKITIVKYPIKIKGGRHLIVEDKRKIITQEDGSKTMLCSLKNVTDMYLDGASYNE